MLLYAAKITIVFVQLADAAIYGVKITVKTIAIAIAITIT